MYTADSAKAWLRRYSVAARDLDLQKERLAAAEARAYHPRNAALTGMPGGGGNPVDTVGRSAANLEKMRNRVATAREAAETIYSEIDAAIQQIGGKGWERERALLELRYLDDEPWEEVNRMFFGRKPDFELREDSFLRSVFYIHVGAVEKIVAILNAQETAQTAREEKNNDNLQI